MLTGSDYRHDGRLHDDMMTWWQTTWSTWTGPSPPTATPSTSPPATGTPRTTQPPSLTRCWTTSHKNIWTRTKIFAGQPQFPAELLFRAGAAPGVRADVSRRQDAEGRDAGRGDLRQLQILARTRARLVHGHHQQQLKYRYLELHSIYFVQHLIILKIPIHHYLKFSLTCVICQFAVTYSL